MRAQSVLKQRGFTLVETAIVLVIIGLLLGGVLKGQELIVQAKIKNVANDLNGIGAAVHAYQDRYKKLPGDDDGAESRWPAAATKKGNGDGVVGTAGGADAVANCTGADADGEICRFWQHLRLAGFVTGDTNSVLPPANAGGGVLQVQDGALGMVGGVICATKLTGKIAIALDAQSDDGKPGSGQLRGTDDATKLKTRLASDKAYVEDSETLYAVCQSL